MTDTLDSLVLAGEARARALGRIEAKVDILVARTNEYDTRLQSLERSRWTIGGAVVVIGAWFSKLAFFNDLFK